jgi:hypothetical protein
MNHDEVEFSKFKVRLAIWTIICPLAVSTVQQSNAKAKSKHVLTSVSRVFPRSVFHDDL